jgi:hypothetical protein
MSYKLNEITKKAFMEATIYDQPIEDLYSEDELEKALNQVKNTIRKGMKTMYRELKESNIYDETQLKFIADKLLETFGVDINKPENSSIIGF